MAKKHLKLNDIRVYYDEKSGTISMSSKDPQLKSRHFHLNIHRGSETGESLFGLLKEVGVVAENHPSDIPKHISLPSFAERFYTKSNLGEDNRLHYPLEGFTLGKTHLPQGFIECKIQEAPHTLIAGPPGTGKTVLLRSIARQFLEIENSTVIYAQLDHQADYPALSFREGDILDNGLGVLSRIRRIHEERMQIIEDLDINGYRNAGIADNPIFVFLDGFGRRMSSMDSISGADYYKSEALKNLDQIIRLGRIAGMFVFTAVNNADRSELPGELKAGMGRRILLGSADPELQKLALGKAVSYDRSLLEIPGRGLVSTYGSAPTIFQGFAEESPS